MDYAFSHANFCICDNNALVKPVNVKELEEESKYRAVAFLF